MIRLIVAMALFVICLPAAARPDALTIRLQISGTEKHNQYFLCIPNFACLSICSACRGKRYYSFEPLSVTALLVANTHRNLALTLEPTPRGCHRTFDLGHTLTIKGKLHRMSNGLTGIDGLSCHVS